MRNLHAHDSYTLPSISKERKVIFLLIQTHLLARLSVPGSSKVAIFVLTTTTDDRQTDKTD